MEQEEEKKTNPNSWALPFGDMITLLMTFFILIISMSTLKMEDVPEEINANQGAGDNIAVTDLRESGLFDEEVMSKVRILMEDEELPPPVTDLEYISDAMVKFITDNQLAKILDLQKTEEGFSIRIRADILFDHGKSVLKQEYLYILDKIAELTSLITNDLNIEGHTDDLYSQDFITDYKLSITRATSVCSYFVDQKMITPSRLAIAGYGKNRPLVPNINDENRAINRRVEILVKEIPQGNQW